MNNADVSSILTAKAKLVAKNTFINSQLRSVYTVIVYQTNLLTFELEDSCRIVLEVSPFTFASLLENDVGVLIYTENGQSPVFENFHRQPTSFQATP